MKLLIVGEGDRDKAVLPHLVSKILDREISHSFEPWARLNSEDVRTGPKYVRKLKMALIQAHKSGATAVAAVVDNDDSKGARLTALREARMLIEQNTVGPPMALGHADPHLEAWLLDDEKAVRTTLAFATNRAIRGVGSVKSPKEELNRLWEESPRRRDNPSESSIDMLAALSRELSIDRCNQSIRTGLQDFADEVRTRITPK
ncbi:MAG: hypothetical protein JNG88_14370 [Phycisphaerales bacterium]|nr:hypothetical protein [Phycisphaerales bacterium]